VDVDETSGERQTAVHLRMRVDDCKGAGGLERGSRSLRGESSEGRIPGTVAARKKAAKLGSARKPLRGCENPGVEPKREWNSSLYYGACLRDTVGGNQEPREVETPADGSVRQKEGERL